VGCDEMGADVSCWMKRLANDTVPGRGSARLCCRCTVCASFRAPVCHGRHRSRTRLNRRGEREAIAAGAWMSGFEAQPKRIERTFGDAGEGIQGKSCESWGKGAGCASAWKNGDL
jgi:hypothetical protein